MLTSSFMIIYKMVSDKVEAINVLTFRLLKL
jgi:hypothetical protein